MPGGILALVGCGRGRFWCALACAAALALALGACKMTSSAPAVCQHLGDRCALREGLQGVCVANESAPCAQPPCLVCTPQH